MLAPLITDLETCTIQPDESTTAFKLAYARWWAPLVLDTDPVLRDFRRFQHEHAIADFRQIDAMVRAQATQRVLRAITHGLPAIQSVPRHSELGLLRHQMELQRPSRSIREMIGAMPENFGKLAPYMLMSPLSIAQYLPPNQALFDVVVFNEASQITTWDAVGAIARTEESSGTFLWRKGTVLPLIDQRDPASDLARLLGIERLAASSRTRLDEAIARARQYMQN